MGSSTLQQALLVGLFLIAYGQFKFSRSFLRNNYVPMVLGLILTLVLSWDGRISRVDGLLLLGAYLIYLYYSYSRRGRTVEVAGEGSNERSTRPPRRLRWARRRTWKCLRGARRR